MERALKVSCARLTVCGPTIYDERRKLKNWQRGDPPSMAELQWQGKELTPFSRKTARAAHAGLYTREIYAGSPRLPSETPPWQNRLIQGERAAVLAALLPEFAGQVNLIYIDPPFMTGRDFKNGSRLAYSDKWQGKLDTYLQWLATTLSLLYPLLATDG